MKPESPIAWVLRILPACSIPLQLASWNEINMKISELRRIQQQDLSPVNMYCPFPDCTYRCMAPPEMDSVDTVVCPYDSSPMALMTWKQMAEEATATMIRMQEHIDHVESILQTQQEHLKTLAAHTLQVARAMMEAQEDKKDCEACLDDFRFTTANERDELAAWRGWERQEPSARFARRMDEELRCNACKGDWEEWKPSLRELKGEIGHHLKKLCRAMQRGNRPAVDEFAADIGNYMTKAIELYGNLFS